MSDTLYDIEIKYTAEFLRGLADATLDQMLTEAQQRYLELRQQTSPHGHVKVAPRPHLFRKVRQDIARIKTISAEVLL